MDDVLRFAKILRRKVKDWLQVTDDLKWCRGTADPRDIVKALDAAIEEFEKHPAKMAANYIVLCPQGHAVKHRRDDEEGVIHVEYCVRCGDRIDAKTLMGDMDRRPDCTCFDAPSTSLDEARKAYDKARYDGEGLRGEVNAAIRYIAALESALAASQAEVERLKPKLESIVFAFQSRGREYPPGVGPGEFGTAGGSHPAPSPEDARLERDDFQQRAEAAEAIIAKLREPLTDEDRESIWVVMCDDWNCGTMSPDDAIQVIVREFLRRRVVGP